MWTLLWIFSAFTAASENWNPILSLDFPHPTSPGKKYPVHVRILPDLTGEGLNDLVVSEPFFPKAGTSHEVGRVRAFSGQDGTEIWKKLGSVLENKGRKLGLKIGVTSDRNGDGLSEVIAQRDFGPNNIVLMDGNSGAVLSATYEQSPLSGIFDIGDTNNDGVSDVLLATKWEVFDDQNLMTTYNGKNSPSSKGKGFKVLHYYAPKTDSNCASSASQLGDIDGDGSVEYLVASPCFSKANPGKNGKNVGRIYVLEGSGDPVKYTKIGNSAKEKLGQAIVGLEDVDSDGINDFAALRIDCDPCNDGVEGRITLFSGKDGSNIRSFSAVFSNKNVRLANAGDFDGDGFGDLLVGGVQSYATHEGIDKDVLLLSGRTGNVLAAIQSSSSEKKVSRVSLGKFNDDEVPDFLIQAEESVRVYPGSPISYQGTGCHQYQAELAPSLQSSFAVTGEDLYLTVDLEDSDSLHKVTVFAFPGAPTFIPAGGDCEFHVDPSKAIEVASTTTQAEDFSGKVSLKAFIPDDENLADETLTFQALIVDLLDPNQFQLTNAASTVILEGTAQ